MKKIKLCNGELEVCYDESQTADIRTLDMTTKYQVVIILDKKKDVNSTK
jgi:hypothetical protein